MAFSDMHAKVQYAEVYQILYPIGCHFVIVIHFAAPFSHSVARMPPASNPACVEVILWNGGALLARTINLENETPIDIARSLGSENACLRALENTINDGRGRRNKRELHRTRSGRGGTRLSGLDDKEEGCEIDVQRIMAVWERFFENAAKACTSLLNIEDVTISDDDADVRYADVGGTKEGRIESQVENNNDGPNLQLNGGLSGERIATADVGYFLDRNGDEGGSIGTGGGRNDIVRPLTNMAEGGTPTTRRSAWDLDSSRYCSARGDEVVQHIVSEKLAEITTSARLQATETTRSPSSDVSRSPAVTHIEETDCDYYSANQRCETTTPGVTTSTDQERVSTAAGADQGPLWVPCWDRESESIYYVHSETGETTWPPLLFAKGLQPNPSLVWDPQRGAFFVVEADGGSRWLDEGNDGHMTAAEGADAVDAVTASQNDIQREDRPNPYLGLGPTDNRPRPSVPSVLKKPCPSPWLQGAQEVSVLNEEDDDMFHEALADEGTLLPFPGHGEAATLNCQIDHSCISDTHELFAADADHTHIRHGVGVDERPGGTHSKSFQEEDDYDITGFFEAREMSRFRVKLATSPLERLTAGAGMSSTTARVQPQQLTEQERAFEDTRLARQDSVDGMRSANRNDVEFFDARTFKASDPQVATSTSCRDAASVIEDNRQEDNTDRDNTSSVQVDLPTSFTGSLPVWMLRSGSDLNSPSYYVNQETGEASWTLPPEVAASSQGWLRAWSEEHQAYFYANEWSGRTTWELTDLNEAL